MRKALIVSFMVHFLLLTGLWQFGWERSSNITVPQIYQVQLVAMPQVQAPPPDDNVPEVEVETIPPPPEEKVKIKPKPLPAKPKTTPQKAPPSESVGQASESLSGVRSDELFEFPSYIRRMTDKIRRNWVNPYAGQQDSVLATVFFRVMKDGQIRSDRVEKSSGNPSFDRAALRAVINSSPLMPLPPDFQENQLTVHLDFEYLRQ